MLSGVMTFMLPECSDGDVAISAGKPNGQKSMFAGHHICHQRSRVFLWTATCSRMFLEEKIKREISHLMICVFFL